MSITITKISSSKKDLRVKSAMATITSIKPVYPLHPDVVMKRLPFYIQNDVIMKPSSLQISKPSAKFQEQSVQFNITPKAAKQIQSSKRIVSGRIEFRHQVQLRFSLLEVSCQQTDAFPKSLCVRVNGKMWSTVTINFIGIHINKTSGLGWNKISYSSQRCKKNFCKYFFCLF